MIKEKTKALYQLLERTPSNEIKWKELIKYLKELEKSQQYVSPTLLEPQDNNKGKNYEYRHIKNDTTTS